MEMESSAIDAHEGAMDMDESANNSRNEPVNNFTGELATDSGDVTVNNFGAAPLDFIQNQFFAAELPEGTPFPSALELLGESPASPVTSPGENQPKGGLIVERILDRKCVDDQTFYLVKKQGFDDQYNSWEPEENLDISAEVFEEFYRSYHTNRDLHLDETISAGEPEIHVPAVGVTFEPTGGVRGDEKVGFARGLEAKEILGVTDCGNGSGPSFLMQWHGSPIADIVPAKEANLKCPQVVIRFYETRIHFKADRTLEQILAPAEDDSESESKTEESVGEQDDNAAADENTDMNPASSMCESKNN